jgi:hypothetical protein
MDRLIQLAQAAPRATLAVPLLLVEGAMVLAVLGLLGPAIFMRSREPFERLMELLELLLVRGRSGSVGAAARHASAAAGGR